MAHKYEGLWESEDGTGRIDVDWDAGYRLWLYLKTEDETDGHTVFTYQHDFRATPAQTKRIVNGYGMIAGPVGRDGLRKSVY